MFFSNINIIVTLIATIVGVVIGFAWHAQWAFGKLWLRERKVMNPHWHGAMIKPMKATYPSIVISTFVTAFVLAALFNSLVITSIFSIILVGLLVWLGFMVPVKLYDYLFGGDTLIFFIITIGHSLVVSVAMSLIIGLFS